jgi:hypothetical protein
VVDDWHDQRYHATMTSVDLEHPAHLREGYVGDAERLSALCSVSAFASRQGTRHIKDSSGYVR